MDNYNVNYSYDQASGLSQTFAKLMRNVYSWMTLALVITALTALVIDKNQGIVDAIFETPGILWGCLIGEFALVMFLSARIGKMAFMTAGLLFGLYSILNGVTLSLILLAYTKESVAQAFFITAGTFAAMSLVGFFVKKDMSSMGRIMMMLLLGMIIATVVNIFMNNSGLAMIINYLGVLIFVGLTAYDTQKIKMMLQYSSQYGVNDETNKIALMGSLSLYLDFINLFLFILRLFGNRR